MRVHIIIETGEGEGLNLPGLTPSVGPEEIVKPAMPPKARGKRLRAGHLKSVSAFGRKDTSIRKEASMPDESFEEVAEAVSDAADSLPFTPAWKKRRRAD